MTTEQRAAALRLAATLDSRMSADPEGDEEAAALLRELAAEPVQDEPVAWMDKYQIGGVRLTEAAYGLPHGAPLYPHPQQQRTPLTDEQLTSAVLEDKTLRYYFALNGGAGPVSEKGVRIFRAIEKAITGETP